MLYVKDIVVVKSGRTLLGSGDLVKCVQQFVGVAATLQDVVS